MPTSWPPPTRVRVSALSILLCLVLAACGSRLDPEDVVAADGEGGTVAADGSLVIGTDPGAVDPGADPGSVGDVGDAGAGTTTDSGAGAPGTSDGAAPGSSDAGDGGNAPVTSKAGSCDGFKNTTGITDDKIVIGNASDISGPVPGLFETSQDAVKAFVTYFNTAVPDGICGRKLELKTYDSRTDAAADQQAYTAACDEVFAMVGSQSAFDSGGANTAQGCGLPDLRAGAVTFARNACKTCFGVQAVNTNFFQNAIPDFVKKNYGDAGRKAGFLYINAGAAAENAQAQVRAMEKRGMNFEVVRGVDISEFNYVPFVQELKDNDVEVVFWTGAYQQSAKLRQTMAQQGYKPKLYLRDPTDYNPDYISQGGAAVDGTVIFMNFTPFEEAGSNKETATYLAWLNQTKPSATPQFFGVWAWSAARLFVELSTELGGKLSRSTLIDAVRGTDDWTALGMHAPQPVGKKGTGECWRFVQLNGGKWSPTGGTKYTCTGVTGT